MRTSTPQQRLPERPISLWELIPVSIVLVTLLTSGFVGHYVFDWSQHGAPLISTGATIGGALLWWSLRAFLVKEGLIHPLKFNLNLELEDSERH